MTITTKDEFHKFKLEWRLNGLEYAARYHSTWQDIDNPKFHELLKLYKSISEFLEEYVDYDSGMLEAHEADYKKEIEKKYDLATKPNS